MTVDQVLHLLRNPYGHPEHELRRAQLAAADYIEAQAQHIKELTLRLHLGDGDRGSQHPAKQPGA